MQTRRLGRTNHQSSLVIFGAAAFGNISQADAEKSLELALAAGVNHIDIAPSYGQAEIRVGPWLPAHREHFFLGCKTGERESDPAWAEANRSLEKLQTDRFELYQLHAVGTFEELEKCFAPGGAIETLVRVRDEGLTRYLGITGHGMETPAVFLEALRRFDFDTVMFPIHPRLFADDEYRRSAEELLNVCYQKDVGVQIIKSVTRGAWGDQTRRYNTWYEPYDEQARISEGVRFALSQKGVAAIPSVGDVRLLPLVLRAAQEFEPMSADEQAALIERSRDLALIFE
jgi:predicted aldo/keto reductase-like oxidoreductase